MKFEHTSGGFTLPGESGQEKLTLELAEKYQVEMPIVQTVNAIVKEGMSASDALRTLMDRNRKNEMPQGYETAH